MESRGDDCNHFHCDRTDFHHHYKDSTGVDWVHTGTPSSCTAPECEDAVVLADPETGIITIRTAGIYVFKGIDKVVRVGDKPIKAGERVGIDSKGHVVSIEPDNKPYTNGKYPYEVIEAAETILSSMETWSDAPEDHRAETPVRFIKMLQQMTTRDPEFKFTTFDKADDTEMITLGPIPFYTLCAHHVVPFFGNAWIGYVPNAKIVGLSKIPRTVKHLAKGFWVQETLTTEIADYLEEKLDPLGVAVVLEAEHMCMAMRGVEVPGVMTRTSAMRGVFGDHARTAKAEFMAGLNR